MTPERWVRLKLFGVILALVWHIALLLAPPLALADSWMPPQRADYFSSDNAYSFTVLPREIDNSLSYFEDRVAGRGQAGQRKGWQGYCLGVLWKWKADGSASQVWRQGLRNAIAPASAMVSTSGDYVVTFDNWYSTGYGNNTIVIYGPGGKFVREFALGDLMPEAAVQALPRSVSSIWWGEGHRFDTSGKYLVLRIVSNGKMPYEADSQFREIRIELATGRVVASENGR